MPRKYSKIYIIGSVASGKTSLAMELSRKLGILCYELDNIVWERRNGGDVKRQPEHRDEIFNQITLSDKWIIEDVLRPCFEVGLKRADLIIVLDTPKRKRSRFILFRWIRQLFGREKANYRPTLNMLKSMYRWSGDYEKNQKDFMKRLEPYQAKTVILKDASNIDSILVDSLH